MKRLEEILKKTWSKDKENEPLDEKYIGETTAIYAAMKLYAREVAQASLEKAAENVALFKEFSEFEFKHWIDKESITNEQNITLL